MTSTTAATRALYGLDNPVNANFGRMCLMARRFAEAGVRFIQVTHNDHLVQWDQHSDLKNGHEKNAREVDGPIAGLLQDLKTRTLQIEATADPVELRKQAHALKGSAASLTMNARCPAN